MSVLQAGGSGEDRFTGISTLSDGSVLLTGSYEAKAGFGNRTLTSAGKSDIFLSRVNSDEALIGPRQRVVLAKKLPMVLRVTAMAAVSRGYFHGDAMFGSVTQKAIGEPMYSSHVWTKMETSSGPQGRRHEYDSAEAASALADGGAIVAGYFEKPHSAPSHWRPLMNTARWFITKVDADGQFHGLSASVGHSFRPFAALRHSRMAVLSSLDIAGTAKLGEFTKQWRRWDSDAYIAKLNSDGEFEWAQRIGGSDFIRIEDISSNASNDIVIAGTFSETAVVGEKSISSAGYADAFVAKFNSQGQFDWVTKAGGTGDDYGHGVTNLPAVMYCSLGVLKRITEKHGKR